MNTTSAEREQLESVRVPSRRPRDEEATTAEGQIVFELPLQEPHHLHGFILEDWARQLCRVEAAMSAMASGRLSEFGHQLDDIGTGTIAYVLGMSFAPDWTLTQLKSLGVRVS